MVQPKSFLGFLPNGFSSSFKSYRKNVQTMSNLENSFFLSSFLPPLPFIPQQTLTDCLVRTVPWLSVL